MNKKAGIVNNEKETLNNDYFNHILATLSLLMKGKVLNVYMLIIQFLVHHLQIIFFISQLIFKNKKNEYKNFSGLYTG